MTSPLTTMKAVKVRGPGDIFVDTEAPIPQLQPDYVLIKVSYVALNPTDWKAASFFKGDTPHTMGCDVTGRVVSLGCNVTRYRIGDRVSGLCYGLRPGKPSSGAFGEYALVKAALSLRVPDHLDDEEGAVLSVGLTISGQSLYQTLKLPFPSTEGQVTATSAAPAVLIYGGNTSTGMFAIQLARLSGCRVLTTCSPNSAAVCKALGAHKTYDYRDAAACAENIRSDTHDDLLLAFDCIAEGDSLSICANALTSRSNEAVYTATLPVAGKFPRQDVKHGWRSGYTSFGEPYSFAGQPQTAKPEDFEFASKMWQVFESLLDQDRLRVGPLVQQRPGGLDGLIQGLSDLRAGSVRGGKLVFEAAVVV